MRALSSHYQLIDSEERALLYPETWLHAPKDAVAKVRMGWYVKVGVERKADRTEGERFWCRVVGVRFGRFKVTTYYVEVNQNLARTGYHGLQDKDLLRVEGKHIFGVLTPTRTAVWEALTHLAR